MLKYTKFFNLLRERGIKQIDLRAQGVHPRIFQKLQRGELIRSDSIDQLCRILQCQPGDIMEYIADEKSVNEGNEGILDCGPGDLMTAGKVECIPAKNEIPDA